ncbi:hypothetical protein MtrunA17_Chr8g0358601 [Medicago truncatula]|uniref:Uncharacterized protein n=1 Tax=Medicago truncatula TaxID=3880 RepID=A0A396GJS3_MEDTR|nr:hypothetical protein MtrunA17_Chr8g0358601 [Medicago truncatula]
MEEEDNIAAATLQKVLELAQEIEVHASNIVREDVGADAQEVIKAAVVEENAGCSEAVFPEASKGNPDSLHSTEIINIKSSTTSTSHSTSISTSSTSSDLDNVPLGRIYTTINKGPSPTTKIHKEPADKIPYDPVYPFILNKIGEMFEMRNKVCERLHADHPFQPPMIKPLSFVRADADVVNESEVPKHVNIIESSSHPSSTNQTSETSVLENLVNHCSGELPGVGQT